MAAVYDGYERLRRERHLIDFESVLELTAAIVLEHRGAAEQVRDTFRYFVVDEYQDVNPLQKLLLDAWLGDRDELCVVGDPHQVIYSFTGATPAYLTGFTAEFPGATRGPAGARLPFDAAGGRGGQPAGPGRRGTYRAAAAPGRSRCSPSTPTTRTRRPGWRSASGRCSRRASRCREIAVLVRINADTERFERALAEAGVPYLVRGAERFYERPIVRQALVLLRGAAPAEARTTGDATGTRCRRRSGTC